MSSINKKQLLFIYYIIEMILITFITILICKFFIIKLVIYSTFFISKTSQNFSLDYENQEQNPIYTGEKHFHQEIKI